MVETTQPSATPWLDGLDIAWEEAPNPPTLASYVVRDLISPQSRIPRRSLAGFRSSGAIRKDSPQVPVPRRRSPLATLSSSDSNTLQKNSVKSHSSGSRSISEGSEGSVVRYNTVQQRAKSNSPAKQSTLEWKRRLLQGQVGYGDQTELFGPSGLDSIFAGPHGDENRAETIGEGPESSVVEPLPSSPPPWPEQSCEQSKEYPNDIYVEGQDISCMDSSAHQSHDNIGVNRTIGGQTELEQEDFSPVFIGKHTTSNGQVNYKAVDSHAVKQFQPLSHLGTINRDESSPNLSLSENLPTGTPPIAPLLDNVQVKRGGYSRVGSFRHRALSSSRLTLEQVSDNPVPDLLPPLSTSSLQLPEAPTPPQEPSTPVHRLSPAPPKSRSSASPLKLFGPHDTFTNNRLLRRMSQLDPDISNLSLKDDEKSAENTTARQSSSASFGNGDLDRHSFTAEITITSATDSQRDDSDRSPGSEVPPPGSRIPLDFRQEISPGPIDTFKMKRKTSKRGPIPGPVVDTARVDESVDEDRGVQSAFGSGKRPPTTPGKDSTPKRRRTLHVSETIDEETNQSQGLASGRKRKDARPGDEMIVADSEILAQRRLLRPRSTTPNQRQREQTEAEIRETAEEFVSQEPERIKAMMDQLESSMADESPPSIQQQARVVANEVAKFSLRVQKASGDLTDRKRSVTTQDFFDEAVMVMKLIREKAGRQSVLGSVAESDQEGLGRSQGTSHYDEDLSSLRISRPPSREGGSGWRPRSMQQTDQRVLSHLKRFQERDDTDFIADSIAVLDMQDHDSRPVVAVDEKANIRISGPRPLPSPKRKEDGPNSQRSTASDFQTQMTQNSQGPPTGRTDRTNSTRKSENVGTLAPDAVAHLIGDHVGGMIFDKETGKWIRIKQKSQRQIYGSYLEPLSNITSDDDPFREISDLPVDELREEEIRRASYNRDTEDDASGVVVGDDDYEPSSVSASRENALHSSPPQVETRASSRSDEELPKVTDPPEVDREDEIEHSELTNDDDGNILYSGGSVVRRVGNVESPKLYQPQWQPPGIPSSLNRNTPRQVSLRRKTLTSRFHADNVEQSELSFVAALPGDRKVTLSLSLSRPVSGLLQQNNQVTHPAPPAQSDRSFFLSDLPDFTVNEEDHERPSERILAQRLAQHATTQVNDRFAHAVKDLVKTLTDVQAEALYSDEIEELDLHGRSLHTLHGLEDYCPRAVRVDITGNSITHLTGAPTSIRQLIARSNLLSSLTSWTHLRNLQKLDVSSNQINDLAGLGCLIHLRELRVDDNEITSLQGIQHLDGLWKLSANRNRLTSLDFAQTALDSLKELDVSGNQIKSVSGLESLPALTTLRLDQNPLDCAPSVSCTMTRIEHLSLRDCSIDFLDVTNLPSIRTLDVDGNRLAHIQGIHTPEFLERLSMRRQVLPAHTQMGILSQPLRARTVHLSGNILPTLNLPHHHLSIQTLELSSCGLQTLPDDFGLRLPNLQRLNLNFNALKDIRPLLNIVSLQSLGLAGNLLHRLRMTVKVLSRFSDTLSDLDLRGNPIVQGFHAPRPRGSSSSGTLPPRVATSDRQLRLHHYCDIRLEDEDPEVYKYILPDADIPAQEMHVERMGEDLLLRRRVHLTLLANGCRRLERLDGEGFAREKVLVKDEIWKRLEELGVIRRKGPAKEGTGE